MDKDYIISKLDNYKIINPKNISGVYKNYNITFSRIKDFISVTIYIAADNKQANMVVDNLRVSCFDYACNCANNNFNYLVPLADCNMERLFRVADEVIDFCSTYNIPTAKIQRGFQYKKGKTVRRAEKPEENILKGIWGAVIGAVPGMVFWILTNGFEYCEVFSGIIIALCVIVGYKKYAGYVGKIGCLLCFLLLIIASVLTRGIIYGAYSMTEINAVQFFNVISELKNIQLWLSFKAEIVKAVRAGGVIVLFKLIKTCFLR